jgi:GT2 family glycosyltransferase
VSARITVVVPTFRRPDGLIRALEALAGQQDPGAPWDVVVVDNDDPPGAQPVFSALAPRFNGRALLVREVRRGASTARNAGIAAAGGEVVAFLDDDVVPVGDWLRQLVEPVLSGRCEGAGGRVLLDPAVAIPRWLGADFLGYLSAFDLGDEVHDIAPDHYVLSASAAFRADALHRVGGFDPVLGPRPGVPMVNDDIDLCRRVMQSGARISYVPSAVVVHDLPQQRLTRTYMVRRTYAQGRSDWLLDRRVNAARPLGGAQGIVVHLCRLLGERAREGLTHPDVAMAALFASSQAAGSLREAATAKLGRRD